jgi:hypothetical protein
MKKETYLCVGAQTNSEWDSVSHCLIPIKEDDIGGYLKTISKTKDAGLDVGTISEDVAKFITLDEDESYDHDLVKADGFGFGEDVMFLIDLTDEQIDSLPKPDNQMRNGETRYAAVFEGIQFVTFGKHTSEEFWTKLIDPLTIGKMLYNKRKEAEKC